MELMDYILMSAVIGFLFFFSNATATIESSESKSGEVRKCIKHISNAEGETFSVKTAVWWPNIKNQKTKTNDKD